MRDYSEHTYNTLRYGLETLPTPHGLRVQIQRLPGGPRFEVYVHGTEAATVHTQPAAYLEGYEQGVRDWTGTRRLTIV